MKLYIKAKVFPWGQVLCIQRNAAACICCSGTDILHGGQIHVFDMTGQELYFIQQKLFRFLPEYHIFAGDILCAIVKRNSHF